MQVSTACGSGRVVNVPHPPTIAGGTDLKSRPAYAGDTDLLLPPFMCVCDEKKSRMLFSMS
jgi:hypothetical protein